MSMPKLPVVVTVVVIGLAFAQSALADVTVSTPASASISADTTSATHGNGTFTALNGPVLSESVAGDIGVGTVVLDVPAGFVFGGTAPTCAGDQTKLVASVTANDAGTITCTVSQASTGPLGISTTPEALTFSGVQVRPTAGNPLASGSISLDPSSSSSIAGVDGSTHFGTLTEIVGAPAQLLFSRQPVGNVLAGVALSAQPAVKIEDVFGHVETSDTSHVVVSLAPNTAATASGAALSGTTLDLAASAGVADFTGQALKLSKSGTGFVLAATDAAESLSATSNPFDLTGVASIGVSTPSTAARAAMLSTVTVTLLRNDGSPASAVGEQEAVGVSLGGSSPTITGLLLGGTVSQTTVAGTKTFTDLTVNKSGTGFELAASATNGSPGLSGSFDVTGVGSIAVSTPSSTARSATLSTVTATLLRDDGSPASAASEQEQVALALGGSSPAITGLSLGGTVSQMTALGVKTFADLSVNKSGTGFELNASATNGSAGTSGSFDVTGVGSIAISTPSSAARAATLSAVTVTLTRDDGSPASAALEQEQVAISFAGSSPAISGLSLGGTLSQTSVAGATTFTDLTVSKSGTGFALHASATNGSPGTSGSFDITGVGSLTVSAPSTAARSATLSSVTVTLLRDDGSPASTGSEQEQVGLSLGGSSPAISGLSLGGTASQATVAGARAFTDLTVNRSGTGFELAASATNGSPGVSGSFDITGVGSITVSTPSAAARSATLGAVTVALLRDDGSPASAASEQQQVVLSLGGSSPAITGLNLGGTASQSTVAGAKTFTDLTVNKSGTGFELTAADSADSLSVDSNPFAITGVGSIAVSTPSSAARSATLSAVTVTLTRDDGSPANAAIEQEQVALSFAGSSPTIIGLSLGGTLSQTTVSGTTTFVALTVNKSGTGFALSASATDGSPGTSGSFDITGIGSIVFSVQPAGAVTGAAFGTSPKVRLLRDDGTPEITDSSTVITLTIKSGTGTGGATVSAGEHATVVNGVASFSGTTIDTVGTGYVLTASDGTDTTSSDAFAVDATSTATSVDSSPSGSIVVGQSVTFTATVVSSSATGTVTFKDGGVTIGIGSVNGFGVATLTTSALTVGSHSVTAVYSGDSSFGSSTSSVSSLTVLGAATTTTVGSSASPSSAGGSVTFTATVTVAGGGTPTGMVTFMDGAVTLGTVALDGSGVASLTTSSLGAGSHFITAVYAGDADNESSTSAATTEIVDSPAAGSGGGTGSGSGSGGGGGGGGGSPTTTTTTTTTEPTTVSLLNPVRSIATGPSATATVTPSAPTAARSTQAATAKQSGSLSVAITAAPETATAGSAPAVVTAIVNWAAGAIATNAKVVETPITAPLAGGFQASAVAVQVMVTAADGTTVHAFAIPLQITFKNVSADDFPTTSETAGTTWRAIPLLTSLPLPSGQPDGYIRTGSTITIYTHHLSLFAVQRPTRAIASATETASKSTSNATSSRDATKKRAATATKKTAAATSRRPPSAARARVLLPNPRQ
jgi:predicted esterase YcpF (UPF0227 family)